MATISKNVRDEMYDISLRRETTTCRFKILHQTPIEQGDVHINSLEIHFQ